MIDAPSAARRGAMPRPIPVAAPVAADVAQTGAALRPQSRVGAARTAGADHARPRVGPTITHNSSPGAIHRPACQVTDAPR
jgi:hypothetical protein